MTPTWALLLGILAVGGLLTLVAAWVWPRRILPVAYFVLLVAGTKFRNRDPMATVSAQLDWNVAMELGLYILVAAATFVVIRVYRPRIGRPGVLETALGVYVLFALVSVLWSPSAALTLTRGGQLVILYFLATVAIRVLGPREQMRALMVGALAYIVVAAGLAIVLPFEWARNVYVAGRIREWQFAWFAAHPIAVGTWVGITMALLASGALLASREWRGRILTLPLWVWLVPLMAIMVAARSRGPLAAILVTLAIIAARRWASPAVMTTLSSLTVAGVIVFVGFADRIAAALTWAIENDLPVLSWFTRNESLEYLFSLGGRTELWGVVLRLSAESPLVGHGFMASRDLLAERVPWAGYAHNALGQTMLDFGIVGIVLLWVPLLVPVAAALFKARWRPSPAQDARGLAFGVLLFQVLNGMTSESFAGAPSFETLVVMSAIMAFERSAWTETAEGERPAEATRLQLTGTA